MSTVYLSEYQPPCFEVKDIHLEFDLFDDHALVTNTMTLKRTHPGELLLLGRYLELESLRLNDRTLSASDYDLHDEHLIISHCPDTANLVIVTRIYPQKNTALTGLYRSNHLFCTQCEAEGFRRITYFPDRPDVLTIYTTQINADKRQYPILLSNGNLIKSGDLANHRHFAIWQDPFKKPSYLFALVAGDLMCVQDSFITCSGRTIDLRIYVEKGNEDKCDHAMISLKKAMRWDEEQYGREYDLDTFMIVAVSDFNMGAMENKGLNIFNSKYILASPNTATDQDYAGIESVVAHEYFHNWTGNRITCRDWFQLSLKEGLTVFRDQEFSRDMNSRDVNRIGDVKTLRNIQFPEDAGRMAHPVRPESYQEINNFYTATVYNKGAEVIRMQQTLLSANGFRAGMDLYFQRHDGQAVTINEFVAAMEDANQVDLTQFKRWYSQSGTPSVQANTTFDKGYLNLTLTQSCPDTPENKEQKPFHIPIRMALFDQKGKEIPLEQSVLELRETRQTFLFGPFDEKPIVSLLRDFSAPIILQDNNSEEERLHLLKFETNGFAKWEAAQTLARTHIRQCYEQQKWTIPNNLFRAYETILKDPKLDDALRAELLTPPGFEDMAATISHLEVDRLEVARDSFRNQLGTHLSSDLHNLYQTLWKHEDHAMNPSAYMRRKLRNVCLWLLMKANEQEALPLCLHQFSHAKTMTDQIASLSLLINSSQREHAIETFYQQWQHDELVLDKWFSLQALCELPGTLEHVKTLLSHPKFHITNPNRVRAVIGSFTQNPRHFHAKNGSGYAFLTENLLKIDAINPQIAARLATPFTRWQRLDVSRQTLIQQELKRLSSHDLSVDLNEMVEKSLH